MRVGDVRSRPSRYRQPEQPSLLSSRWVIPGIAILAVIVLGMIGVYLLSSTNLFAISQVRVVGVSHLTEKEMTELASVPSNTTLLRVDTKEIEDRLTSNPWVEKASVHRALPDTLELQITERTIAAVVDVPLANQNEVQNWAIASDGMWLMEIPKKGTDEAASVSSHVYEDAEKVLHITDLPYGVSPVVGSYCSDSSVTNALDIVSGLSTELADQVSVVSATDTVNTQLTLKSGVQIAFGAAERIRDKERVCLKLLAEHPDQISYINVRVVDKPTWRSISQA